jgi:transcriptional regulator with XRE-family HTH domain
MRKDRLKQIMVDKGHNAESLAEVIGRSERSIWRILSEGGNTSDETVALIASALEVSADYLLGLSDEPSPNMRLDNITTEERAVIAALRRGDDKGAIRIIVSR